MPNHNEGHDSAEYDDSPDDQDGQDWAERNLGPSLGDQEPVPDDGYTRDWESISYTCRQEVDFRCERCDVDLSTEKRLLHVHHEDRNKLNNRPENLKVLCLTCHADEDGHAHFRNRPGYCDATRLIESRREATLRADLAPALARVRQEKKRENAETRRRFVEWIGSARSTRTFDDSERAYLAAVANHREDKAVGFRRTHRFELRAWVAPRLHAFDDAASLFAPEIEPAHVLERHLLDTLTARDYDGAVGIKRGLWRHLFSQLLPYSETVPEVTPAQLSAGKAVELDTLEHRFIRAFASVNIQEAIYMLREIHARELEFFQFRDFTRDRSDPRLDYVRCDFEGL